MRVTSRGFALVELLAAMVITALLGAATVRLIDRAQRFAVGSALASDQQAQLAVAAFAIDGLLASISPGDGDLVQATDSAVAFEGTVGVGVACEITSTHLVLPPPVIAAGSVLQHWNTSPQAGDSLFVWDEGSSAGSSDDQWYHSAVTGVSTQVDACRFTPWLDSIADAGKVGWRITPSTSLPASVTPGAIVRLARLERIALYRSGSEWTLGWTEWNVGSHAWNLIQPFAGSLLSYSPTPSGSGFGVTWHDSAAGVLASGSARAARGARVRLGSLSRRVVKYDGTNAGLRRDSTTRIIPLRNAR